MNRSWTIAMGALLAVSGLVGCGAGGDRLAGGGATETGNGIVLQVVSGNGAPAPLAQVTFVRTDTWLDDLASQGAPRVVRAVTDAQGLVVVDTLPPGEWAVQGEWSGQRGLATVARADSSQVLHLCSGAGVHGHLSGDSASFVWVSGTAWHSRPDSHRDFDLWVAPGTVSLVAIGTARIAPVAVVKAMAGRTQAVQDTVDYRRIVIDDFSEGDHTTTISRYIGFGGWYTTSDMGTRIFSTANASAADFHGQLDMQYISKDTAWGYAIAGIAFHTDTGYHDIDLSKMDSLCFDQKGVGQNTVLIQHIQNSQVAHQALAWAGNLTGAWTHVCVTPAKVGNMWDSVQTTTNNISFSATHGSRLDLRNIVLWGVPLQKLAP